MTGPRVPCPNCTDGFVSTGDRHARTAKDVCPHCAGTGMVAARTGETPEASFHAPPSTPALTPDSAAVGDIIAERARQIAVESWTPDHDDIHDDGALARAAAAYALVGGFSDRVRANLISSSWGGVVRSLWPAAWDLTWFKPKDRRRDLVRAGALIVAEIERLDRAEAARG